VNESTETVKFRLPKNSPYLAAIQEAIMSGNHALVVRLLDAAQAKPVEDAVVKEMVEQDGAVSGVAVLR
jgi:hypothetical protein